MDEKITSILFSSIRVAVCGELLPDKEKEIYSNEMLPEIIKIARHHDVVHLLGLGLKENGLIDNDACNLEHFILKAIYRYEQIKHTLTKLCNAFEAAQIIFVPLKGSVIKEYYPEPWMRTSCDIDVLVRESDLDKAVDFLVNNLGYTYKQKYTHDVSLFSPSGVHVELHYSLMDDEPIKSSFEVLGHVWDTVEKKKNCNYWHELPDEMFYFYHIAHMAKHFENGGCGIRAFIDLYILNNKVQFDRAKRIELLERGDLKMFENQANLLADIWFGEAKHTETTKKMEDYIMRGGVYGSAENHVAVQQQKKGGKIRYAISKIWLPYDMIKYYYPILGKHKIFTPIMEIRRWLRLLFGGHFKRVTKVLNCNSCITEHQAKETRDLLRDIGL